jgi:hypothetical protein
MSDSTSYVLYKHSFFLVFLGFLKNLVSANIAEATLIHVHNENQKLNIVSPGILLW